MVWGNSMPITLCLWHIQRCWLNHLVKKILSKEAQQDIMHRLGEGMYMGTVGKTVMKSIAEARENVYQFFLDH